MRGHWWLIPVALVVIAVRLPALLGPVQLSPDATEYLDIARNVSGGEGLTLKIRAYFFGDGYTVPYPAASLRSPAYPWLMGQVHALGPGDGFLKWFNFGLFLLNLTLLGLVLRQLLPPGLLAYALLLVGITEPMFLSSVFPWAEQTALLWLLIALLLFQREIHRRWGAVGAALEGLVAALAALSRPEYLLVGLLGLAWLSFIEARRSTTVAGFLAGWLLPLALFATANYVQHGRTFLPGDYLFRSREYSSWFAFDGSAASSMEFVASHWLWIMGRVLRNAVNYLAKLVGWKNLFLLAVSLPLVVRKGVRAEYDWKHRQLVLVATAFFLAYCLVWAGIDRERYLLAITPFLLPLCLLEVDRWRRESGRLWGRRLALLLMCVQLPILLAHTVYAGLVIAGREGPGERFYADENPAWRNPDVEAMAEWIRNNVDPDEPLCLENPFLFNHLTRRPTVLLSEHLAPARLRPFLAHFDCRYVVTNATYSKSPASHLAAVAAELEHGIGMPVADVGTYRVWAVRAAGEEPRERQ